MSSLIDLDYKIFSIGGHEKIKDAYLNLLLIHSANNYQASVQKSNIGGWQSVDEEFDDFDNPDNVLSSLFTPMMQEFSKYTSNLTLREGFDLRVRLHYWWNVNFKGNFNSPHDHVSKNEDGEITLISGCYYLQKPEDSGNIVFLNNKNYLKNFFEDEIDNEIDIKEGECILFSPDKMHYVLPNSSNKLRVSLAFNIHVTAHPNND